MFKDVYYTPVSVETLKSKVYQLLGKKAKGIYNICSNERLTKYEFGLLLAKSFGYSVELIKPISIEDRDNLTKRPKDMSLSNHKLSTFLCDSIPSLDEQVKELNHKKLKENDYPIWTTGY